MPRFQQLGLVRAWGLWIRWLWGSAGFFSFMMLHIWAWIYSAMSWLRYCPTVLLRTSFMCCWKDIVEVYFECVDWRYHGLLERNNINIEIKLHGTHCILNENSYIEGKFGSWKIKNQYKVSSNKSEAHMLVGVVQSLAMTGPSHIMSHNHQSHI